MKAFLNRLHFFGGSGSLFDRYYAAVVESGSGYPTADEARRDYRRTLANVSYPHWM